MRSGAMWFVAMVVAAGTAACLTEQATPVSSQTTEAVQVTPEASCPDGWVDCCDDGTCIAVNICPFTECAWEVRPAPAD